MTEEDTEREAAERQRRERIIQVDDFKQQMGTPQGRRVVWRLMAMTGIFRNAYSGDALATAFRCGEQNIGHQILSEIHELTPELYHTMVREAQK